MSVPGSAGGMRGARVTWCYEAASACTPCLLLHCGATSLLVNPGAPPDLSPDALLSVPLATMDAIKRVQGVIITHPTIAHCGALPALVALFKKAKRSVPVYATKACHRLAQLACYEALWGRLSVDAGFEDVTLKDIDAAFALTSQGGNFTQLSYGQSVTLQGVTFHAAPAGHCLGAAVWLFRFPPDSVLLALQWNHRTEAMLPRCVLPREDAAASLSMIITDAIPWRTPNRIAAASPQALFQRAPVASATTGGSGGSTDARLAWDRELAAGLAARAAMTGNCLLPATTTGRALELAMRLDAVWEATFPPLFFVSPIVENTLEYAATMLEYMSERMTRELVNAQSNPFRKKKLRFLKLIPTPAKLPRVERGGVVAIVPAPDLDVGVGAQLLRRWATDASTLILFTDPSSCMGHSVGARLLAASSRPAHVQCLAYHRQPLDEDELRDYFVSLEQEEDFSDASDVDMHASEEAREWEGAGGAWAGGGMDMHDGAEEDARMAGSDALDDSPNSADAATNSGVHSASGAGGGGVPARAVSEETAEGGGGGEERTRSAILARSVSSEAGTQWQARVEARAGVFVGLTPAVLDKARAGGVPIWFSDDDRLDAGTHRDRAQVLLLKRFALFGALEEPHLPVRSAGALDDDDELGAQERSRLAASSMFGRPVSSVTHGLLAAAIAAAKAPPSLRAAAAAAAKEAEDAAAAEEYEDAGSTAIRQHLTALRPGMDVSMPGRAGSSRAGNTAAALPQGSGGGGGAPTKLLLSAEPLEVWCEVASLAMDGLVDPTSAANLFKALRPRNIVLCGADDAARAAAQSALSGVCASVLSAHASQPSVQVPSITDLHSVSMSPSLMSSARWVASQGWRVAHVQAVGVLAAADADAERDGAGEGDGGAEERDASVLLQPCAESETTDHAATMLRHEAMRVSDVRKLLRRGGVAATLQEGGTLVTSGGIILRCRADGNVEMEGPYCPDYFKVRALLYNITSTV